MLDLIATRYVPRTEHERDMERARDMARDANAACIDAMNERDRLRAAVLDLAQQWETAPWSRRMDCADEYAAELRALTEQEPGEAG